MILGRPRRVPRRPSPSILFLASIIASACGGGPTGPPPPPPPDAAIRIELEFDGAAGGLEPAGFLVQHLSRIDVLVEGGLTPTAFTMFPSQTAAFLAVRAGTYTISAMGFYETDLVLFAGAPQTVTVVTGDTVDVALAMQPTLGEVTFEVAGKREGVVEAVAGDDVPFLVTVRNTQGRPVPNSTVLVTSAAGFGGIAFEGTNATDLEGRAQGVIRAPHSGAIGFFSLTVDGRQVPVPTGLRVEFESAVDPSLSDVTDVTKVQDIVADGFDSAEFGIIVRNEEGEPLPGVPVAVSSSRNDGVEKRVDWFVAVPGYESGKTDELGRFRFAVRSTTSSFLELDAQGRLFSRFDAGRVFHPATIRVVADGIPIDQRDVTFTSVVNPTGAALSISPQFVAADGQSSAVIVVRVNEIPTFGGGPAAGVFVELSNSFNQSVLYQYDIRPEPGFDGFRTNAQGEWRGRIRSTQPCDCFFEAKADGRALTVTPRSVFFQ